MQWAKELGLEVVEWIWVALVVALDQLAQQVGPLQVETMVVILVVLLMIIVIIIMTDLEVLRN
jgi:hypothetical protein